MKIPDARRYPNRSSWYPNNVKEDILSSCAELEYGTPLRLPADMLDTQVIKLRDDELITNLRNNMRQENSISTSAHCNVKYYIHTKLKSC